MTCGSAVETTGSSRPADAGGAVFATESTGLAVAERAVGTMIPVAAPLVT